MRKPKWLNQEVEQMHHDQEQKKLINKLKSNKALNHKGLKQLISILYKGESLQNLRPEYKLIKEFFVKYKGKKNENARKLFHEILQHLVEERCTELIGSNEYLSVIFLIVQFSSHFVNEPFTWKKNSHNVRKQMSSLLRHCFAKYSIPAFFDQVWYRGSDDERLTYIEIGAGVNIRKCTHKLFPFSKKVGHFFMQAPEHYTLQEAFIYAELKSLGASPVFINIVKNYGYLSYQFSKGDQQAWLRLFEFLVKQKDEDLIKTHDKVFEYYNLMIDEETEFKLKGRTLQSIYRLAVDYLKEQEKLDKGFGKFKWNTANEIQQYKKMYDENDTLFELTIIELCSARELLKEGKRMKNCVATYTSYCVKNENRIFSIRKENWFGHNSTAATVEIDPEEKRVTEAKAPCNEDVKGSVLQFLNEWALLNGFTVDKDL